MVEIDFKIVITGIICLTFILVATIYLKRDNDAITALIIAIIAGSIGVFIPTPKIDNKNGVLIW